MKRHLTLLALATLCLVATSGCGRVARTITIDSEPPGAIVWLNDNEVGRTPVTVPFTWYGTYRVYLEKDGYEPMTELERIAAPWWQWVGPDLVAETVIPGTHHDEHHLGPYVLEEVRAADPDEVLTRARTTRQKAIVGVSAE